MPFVMDKSKSKKGLQYLKDSPYSTEVQRDISDLPFVQNEEMYTQQKGERGTSPSRNGKLTISKLKSSHLS